MSGDAHGHGSGTPGWLKAVIAVVIILVLVTYNVGGVLASWIRDIAFALQSNGGIFLGFMAVIAIAILAAKNS